ncbi:hypothetical protein SEA_NAIRB_47 [Mycobacterium phage Nairb]|uniref:Helix-turn-helix DNA binding domain protein n=5 Tax=Bernalvirus bernal13 TaxID=1982102 RepID=A0A2P1JRR4_9CAUD|nr:replication initiation protein [Mycobacterium phage Bernal13]AIT13461.1 hypothetical protein PBI_RONRAYGUN_48 [Mycobacterium phage RonRayGun]ASJ79128.1 hypothetical protein SEA_ZENTIME222_47 [Mycobacterium phage ZenTime222]AVO21835.1 hypothetical protein SEA_NAIRB_47 [Mycobacterium phage Nairb]QBP28893.1 hypothetical protein SEA_IBRAHIM_48 [Mycobacterium phage Ibrahim]QHB47452.1 hypothetical protein SEA_WHITTY_47 [Mycobacterium phage Whitty]
MRIRTIKPEFWRSLDIAQLDWETRFIFIGLWSYVDDNGVGVDRVALIAADLFADDVERDARETFARVSRGLQRLFEAGRIARYTVDGRDYIEIVNWSKHQKIDRPNKPRYPTSTSANAQIRETLANVSRDIRETPSTGTGEQGNRGTEELPPYPPDEPPAPARNTAQRKTGTEIVRSRYADLNRQSRSTQAVEIVDAFAAHLGTAFVPSVRDGIADQVQTCIRSGIHREQIERGLLAWQASDSFSPKQIGTFVAKAAHTKPNGVGKPTQKAMGWDEVGQALIEQVTSQNGDLS